MPDIIDDAQAHEAHFLAQALDRAKPTSGPVPDVIDGVVCCAECGEPIPAARLAALPGVGLCVGCAEEMVSIAGGA